MVERLGKGGEGREREQREGREREQREDRDNRKRLNDNLKRRA